MFVTFEGTEGAGKSTQVERLKERLRCDGVPFLLTREPGGTQVGMRLRELVLDPDVEMQPLPEFFLYSASRYQLAHEVIRPALSRGELVICDRYADSSLAYQGYGRGLDMQMLRQITHEATGGLMPDLTILIDLDPEIGLARVASRGRPDRLEQADLYFHKRVRQGFLDLAKNEAGRFLVLDGSRHPDELQAVIWDELISRA